MKKKKGFTLVELLVVIGLLAVVLAIAIPAYISVKNKSLEKQYENVASRIETAAETYAKETSIVTVSVEELIKSGYIIADDQTDIYNPINGESLNCKIVEVKKENESYEATLTDNGGYDENNKCRTYEVKSADLINAECYSQTNNASELQKCNDAYNNTGWYTGSVKLTVKDVGNGRIVSYHWTSLTGETGNDSSFIVTAEKGKVTTYSVTVKYEDGSSATHSLQIKLDNEAPVVTNIEVNNAWTKENKDVKVNASDGNFSGVDSYYIGTNPTCPASEYTASNTKSFEMGTYYACVKDKVGNISGATTFIVDKIDKTAPTCTTASFSGTTINPSSCTDSESGIKDTKYYLSTDSKAPSADSEGWKDLKDIAFSPTCGKTYYLFVKSTDMAGNVYISDNAVGTYYRACSSGGSSSSSGGVKSSSGSSSSSSGNTCDTVCKMEKNSAAWWKATTKEEKDALHQANVDLAKTIGLEEKTNYSQSGAWSDKNGNYLYGSTNSSKTNSSSGGSAKKTGGTTDNKQGLPR